MKKIPIYHNQGISPCNEIAWYYTGEESLNEDTTIYYKTTLFIDGTRPKETDLIRCSSCGKLLDYVHIDGVGINYIT